MIFRQNWRHLLAVVILHLCVSNLSAQFNTKVVNGVTVTTPDNPFFQMRYYPSVPGGTLFVDNNGYVNVTTPTVGAPVTYTTLTPGQSPTFVVDLGGDSRFAGQAGMQTNQTFLSQLILQPQFKGRTQAAYNDAVAGTYCSESGTGLAAMYQSTIRTHRPALNGGYPVFLFIEDGINAFAYSVTVAQEESCLMGVLQSATADGITPIISTVLYNNAQNAGTQGTLNTTVAQDTQRQQLNQWIRSLQNAVMNGIRVGLYDFDARFPYTTANPFNGTPSSTVNITGYSISGGVATFQAANTFAASQTIYLSGFPSTSSCLNYQSNSGTTVGDVVVLSTGLSASQFEVNVNCPSVSSSSDAGYAQVIAYDGEHLGPWGTTISAQAADDDFGAYLSNVHVKVPVQQDFFNPASGTTTFGGNLAATGNLSITGNATVNGSHNVVRNFTWNASGGGYSFNLGAVPSSPLFWNFGCNCPSSSAVSYQAGYIGITNDSTNYFGLQVVTLGNSNPALREVQLQTQTNQVGNAGIIRLQQNGGQVAIGAVMFNGTTAAAANCNNSGSLTGVTSCASVNVGGATHYIPIF